MSNKLSICIPTYNRARYLAETLDNVIAQATDEVEIVVSDNASPDDTAEIVKSRQEKFPRLTYFRQPENLGADRNYLQSVALASGEWCWLLGDDDLLEPGAIACVLEHLHGPRPLDFLLLLVTVYDARMQTVLERSADVLEITQDIYTTDVPGFFTRFFQESYLSIFVVRRDKWNTVDAEKYVGTGLTYLGITYEYLEANSPVLLIARPLVKYRSMNISWTANTLEIVLRHQRFVMDTLPARYDAVKPAAYAIYEKRTPVTLKMLCFLRSEGSYDLPRYGSLVAPYFAASPRRRLAARLIASAPIGVMRVVRRVYKAVKYARTGRNDHGRSEA